MPKIGNPRRLSRSRPCLPAAAGAFGFYSELHHVQHAVVSDGEHVRLLRYDLRRRDGTVSKIESRVPGRQLRLAALAALAHGRIRRAYGRRGTSRNEARTP